METLSFSHYQIVYSAFFFAIATLLVAFAVGRGSGSNRTKLITIIQSE